MYYYSKHFDFLSRFNFFLQLSIFLKSWRINLIFTRTVCVKWRWRRTLAYWGWKMFWDLIRFILELPDARYKFIYICTIIRCPIRIRSKRRLQVWEFIYFFTGFYFLSFLSFFFLFQCDFGDTIFFSVCFYLRCRSVYFFKIIITLKLFCCNKR